MDAVGVAERVQHIVAVRDDAAACDDLIESALVAVREVQAWADAQHGVLVAKLSADGFAEARVAKASKTSLGAAVKATQRSKTLAATPKLAGALGDGATTAAHIDVVTRAAAQLPAAQRNELLAHADGLVAVAAASTPEQFARRVAVEAKRIQADDGLDRLARQRRNVRVSTWVDADGMWNLRGRFDPLTGVRLAAKLAATVEAMFAQTVPEGCPDDPFEKQRFLAGHALIALIDATAGVGRAGRAEFVVVIDADADPATDGPGPVAQWPIPVEIPARVLAELAGDADIHAVVVRNGVVLHAPGELNLGRSTRLANRAQRRALRGLYRGCAIPGCSIGYDHCKLHHIIWWRHGGAHRSRQPDPDLHQTSRQDPQRRLDHRTRTPPRTHPATPRRHHPQHRTTQPTHRRLSGLDPLLGGFVLLFVCRFHLGQGSDRGLTPRNSRVSRRRAA